MCTRFLLFSEKILNWDSFFISQLIGFYCATVPTVIQYFLINKKRTAIKLLEI